MTQDTADILAARRKTHGEYTHHARVTQGIMRVLMSEPGYAELPDIIRETLHMTAHKMGRVVTGNPFIADHYLDIEGYNRLVRDRIVDGVGLAPGHEQSPLAVGDEQHPEGDLWSQLAEHLGLPRAVAKEQGLALLFGLPSAAQRTMAADMAEARPAPRIERSDTNGWVLVDGTGTRVRIGDPVYINGRADMGHLRAIRDHPDVEKPLLIEFHTSTAHAEEIWAPLRGTVYARQARAVQEPQERFQTEDHEPAGTYERLVPRGPFEPVLQSSATEPAPTGGRGDGTSPGSPEDGGHHASAQETEEVEESGEDLRFSSEVRLEPRVATWKEFTDLGSQLIGHGTRRGDTWKSLYSQNGAGSFTMHSDHQDEYGR